MSTPDRAHCGQSEVTCAYAAQALAANEAAAAEAHIAACPDCQREVESLRGVSWPTDVLRPTTSLQRRLALRIAEETGTPPVLPSVSRWSEPEWEQVAPGIECKLLATDTERQRVSMLVRLAPGTSSNAVAVAIRTVWPVRHCSPKKCSGSTIARRPLCLVGTPQSISLFLSEDSRRRLLYPLERR